MERRRESQQVLLFYKNGHTLQSSSRIQQKRKERHRDGETPAMRRELRDSVGRGAERWYKNTQTKYHIGLFCLRKPFKSVFPFRSCTHIMCVRSVGGSFSLCTTKSLSLSGDTAAVLRRISQHIFSSPLFVAKIRKLSPTSDDCCFRGETPWFFFFTEKLKFQIKTISDG